MKTFKIEKIFVSWIFPAGGWKGFTFWYFCLRLFLFGSDHFSLLYFCFVDNKFKTRLPYFNTSFQKQMGWRILYKLRKKFNQNKIEKSIFQPNIFSDEYYSLNCLINIDINCIESQWKNIGNLRTFFNNNIKNLFCSMSTKIIFSLHFLENLSAVWIMNYPKSLVLSIKASEWDVLKGLPKWTLFQYLKEIPL